MRAIVLSGGGAKGAYQVGVWKALRKLHIKYDIITGTSIGAINGMMMTQNDYNKCLNMWKKINYTKLYKGFGNTNSDVPVKEYLDGILKGGLDTSKIKKIINDFFNSKKLYNSKIKFGVVSYNLTKNMVINSTKENTPSFKLTDYILASATCFPVFKPTIVDNEVLIDGGYYDNIPINLAIDMGADEIIAVDLESIGKIQKVKDESVKITYIRPNNKLSSFLRFEKDLALQMINLGYNDTMKKFNKLDGNIYTFKKNTISKIVKKITPKINKVLKESTYMGCLNNLEKNKDLKILGVIENALEIFELPVDKIYNIYDINKLLFNKLDKCEALKIKKFDLETIKKMLSRKAIVKYIYEKLEKRDKINAVFNFFADEYSVAIYLLSLRR